MRRGQRTFRRDNMEDRHTCYISFLPFLIFLLFINIILALNSNYSLFSQRRTSWYPSHNLLKLRPQLFDGVLPTVSEK